MTLRSRSLVIDLIDLVAKHKSGELRCPATALIIIFVFHVTDIVNRDVKQQIKITQVYVVTSWFYSCI